MNLLEFVEKAVEDGSDMTKSAFGQLIHGSAEDIAEALSALEEAGDYDNLPD